MFLLQQLLIIISILAIAVLSYKFGKLTLFASQLSVAIALLIYLADGIPGLALLATFFLVSVFATFWNRKLLKKTNFDYEKRDASQVFANGGVAAILSFLILIFPENTSLFHLLLASSLSAALSDTLSSELGITYGRRFINILTFKKDERGLDGVISLEGLLFGLLGACLVAGVDGLFYGFDLSTIIIVAAGMIGNLCDSVLGAALERRNKLTNNAVNFISIGMASLSALFIFYYT